MGPGRINFQLKLDFHQNEFNPIYFFNYLSNLTKKEVCIWEKTSGKTLEYL